MGLGSMKGRKSIIKINLRIFSVAFHTLMGILWLFSAKLCSLSSEDTSPLLQQVHFCRCCARGPMASLKSKMLEAQSCLRQKKAACSVYATSFTFLRPVQVLVDVGRFENEEEAARAYDRAAVWCLGLTAHTNFPLSNLIQVGGPSGFSKLQFELIIPLNPT